MYDREGREKGRVVCDDGIVKALTKGPDRIRPLSREELKMEIEKLKEINLNLEGKIKGGDHGNHGHGQNGNRKGREDD